MAFGGGTFSVMNKVLPGTYINFDGTGTGVVDTTVAGVVAIPMLLDWGSATDIIDVTREDVIKNSLALFGYQYTVNTMKNFRELFQNASRLLVYRINGDGTKAGCTYATAKYEGTRGNDITIVIKVNVDDANKFDVETYIDNYKADKQTVATAAELVSNDFVDFKEDATLAATAGTKLTGGANGTTTGQKYSDFLDKISTYQFNVLAVATTTDSLNTMFAEFCKEMRENVGVKFQTVLYNCAADYEGVINVKNTVKDVGANGAALVHWVAGLCAGKQVNETAMNNIYTGEYDVDTDYSQSQLAQVRAAGEFTLHRVGDEVRVLYDINSLTSTSDTKGEVFKENQTIRVIDYIANAVATIFNTSYIGVVPNDEAGRAALWSDILSINTQLENVRAIDTFDEDTLTVSEGNTKRAVVVTETITVIGTMEQLYMTVTVE